MMAQMIHSVVNHLWQSTLFGLGAAVLNLGFRRNRAQVRYWLWFSASAKFLIPFSLLTALGSSLEWAPAASHFPAPAISQTVLTFAEPFPDVLPEPLPARRTRNWIPTAAAIFWACGFAVIATIRFRDWVRLRAAIQSSVPLSVAAPMRVRGCPGLLEPGVFGLFRPVLLLPEGITERLTATQLESVLAHELCHVRRRDNLTAAIHMIVEAVFWFHPLVWWIGARLIEEREHACDQAVLSLGTGARDYAEAIVSVCRMYAESPLACVSGVTGADLRKRIEAILTNTGLHRLNAAQKAALACAATMAVAAPILIGLLNGAARAQPVEPAAPRFEVASVRPCRDGGGTGRGTTGPNRKSGTKKGFPGGSPVVSPGRLNTGCAPLAAPYPAAGLIQRVYGRLPLGRVVRLGSSTPISGGPAWIYSDYYTINAEAPGNASEAVMEAPMLQALLEDRFRLKVHRETRQVPVYVLTVAKGGFKLKPATEGSCVQPDLSKFPPPPPEPGRKSCSSLIGPKGSNLRILANESTVDGFAKLLGLALDRPVIDRTGISGKYEFEVEFARDQSTFLPPNEFLAQPSDAPPAPSIFTAVEEQLGLKLESTRGPREFLVIDHIERPTEN